MPLTVLRYHNRTRRPARRFRKRRTGRRRTHCFIRKSGLGNKLPMHFRYSDTVQLNPPTAGIALHVFRASSLFDPDFTGVGHQPLYFDQIQPLYDHYTVVGSKITITGSGSDNLAGTILISLQDDSGTLTTMNRYMETKNRVYRTTNEAGNGVVTVSKKYSCKKFLGISHPLSEKDVSGTLTTNPAENAFFHVVYAGNDSTADFANATLRMIIDYFAILTEPVTPVGS